MRSGDLGRKPQDINDWVRENMAAYKALRVIEFVEALPKSGSGKIMWRQLQELENAATDVLMI